MGRILIADDHDSLRRGLAQALRSAATTSRRRPTATPRSKSCTKASSTCRQRPEDGRQRGLEVLKTAKTLHPTTRGHPDDRVRLRADRRRSDEGRRLRLHPETV